MDTLKKYIAFVGTFIQQRRVASMVVVAVLVFGIIGAGIWLRTSKESPAEQSQREAQELVAAVSKLVLLPTDEQPLIATVSDPAQFKGQAFFERASMGDKILIFNKARKAILYSPSKKLVIDIAPLNAPTPSPTPKR